MVDNRLKTVRKAKRKTQSEIAHLVNISQNAYSYWESGKTRIDNASLTKLANYYGVSLDFLSGRKYKITTPVSEWRYDLQEDYKNGDKYLREYYEYLYGNIIFLDNSIGGVNIVNSAVGEHNTNTINNKEDRLAQMLLLYFDKLPEDKQFDVLAYIKNLSDQY